MTKKIEDQENTESPFIKLFNCYDKSKEIDNALSNFIDSRLLKNNTMSYKVIIGNEEWLLEPTADSYARRTSAYLASELGEFIGNSLENGEDKNIPKELQTTSIQDIWKPDYLAKLLIWLLENHLISVEELGK